MKVEIELSEETVRAAASGPASHYDDDTRVAIHEGCKKALANMEPVVGSIVKDRNNMLWYRDPATENWFTWGVNEPSAFESILDSYGPVTRVSVLDDSGRYDRFL